MPAEIELKLAIDPKHAVRVASLPALQARAGRPTTQKLTSIYFDTPENALLRDGWALRLRRAGRAWVQTLKGEGHAAGGLHAREESEHAIATSELDLYRVESGELRKRLLKWRNAGTLVPRFRTEFRRTAWLVEMPGGDRVECALDRGVVRTQDGKRSEPICEIELELKQGNAGALFELARELARHLPYELEDRSKADRGYALAGGTVAAVAAAPVLRLARDARGGDAFAAILGSSLAHLHHNRRLMLAARRYDPEHVHQMRVALRRMRTAIGVFGRLDAGLKSLPLIDELRWLRGLLGEARDWDVFLGEALPAARRAFAGAPAMPRLTRRAAGERRQARERAGEALASARYRDLLLSVGELAAQAGERESLAGPLVPFAARLLTRRHRRLRALADAPAAQDAQTRHAFRIATKKLRYSAEYFAPLFGGARSERFLRELRAVQDTLGALNDLATARALLAKLGLPQDASMMHLQGLLAGWWMAREDACVQELAKCWKDVKRTRAFWE